MLLAPDIVPHPGHLALLTLVIWTLLALPALSALLFNPLRRRLHALAEGCPDRSVWPPAAVAAVVATDAPRDRQVMPRFCRSCRRKRHSRARPIFQVHIPARPAPRPVLVPRAELSAA
ncbi:MAG: hypothetical protein U1E15_06005 [Hyphomicrobiales bacterium]